MQIILICQYETGSIACNAARIDGIPVNERHYYIVNHQVVLEGNDSVVHHDVDELLAMGDLYRMQTLEEQNAGADAKRKASTASETALDAPVAPKKTSG